MHPPDIAEKIVPRLRAQRHVHSLRAMPSADGEPRLEDRDGEAGIAALSEMRCRCDERVRHEQTPSAHVLILADGVLLDAIVRCDGSPADLADLAF